jgi:plasminogen activator inhibitor 1 RNA-binding protein
MKETHDYKGKTLHYRGNPREKHPYDRRSGTGRGIEIKKDGHGKFNLGRPEDVLRPEATEGAEEVPEDTTGKVGEVKEEQFQDAKKEEEPEDTGLTLEEFLSSKKKATQKKEARKPEEMKKTNIEKGGEKQK